MLRGFSGTGELLDALRKMDDVFGTTLNFFAKRDFPALPRLW